MRAARHLARPVAAIGLLGALSGLVIVTSSSPPANATYGPASTLAASPAVPVPLTGSVTTSKTTWATVLMGKNNGEFNLFWQLFAFNPKTGHFALVTPPGVADNGGLMVAPDGNGTSALVGFGASQGLRFSPLALSVNSGTSWSPGGVPHALVSAPSVVALAPNGRALVLTGRASQAVLSRAGSLTSWTSLVTKSALSGTAAGKACVVGALEAVALSSGGSPLVGTSCREPDRPGVFVDSHQQWHLADVPVPNSLGHDEFATLRLGTKSALFAAVHGKSTSLVAAWAPNPDHPWVVSSQLRLANANDLLASGTGVGSTQFVLVRKGGSVRAETIAGPRASWQTLPVLPKQTVTIAFSPAGQIDALSVDDTKLSVFRLGPDEKSWTKTQTITVPIVSGSSS